MPKRIKQADFKAKMIEIKHTKINLTLDYTFIGNWYALCSYNDNDEFEEDRPPEEFSRDEFRMNNNRLKRIMWSIELYLERGKDLKNFTYPNLSYLFYLFVAVSCLLYDNNNCLHLTLFLLLVTLIYNSPVYTIYIRDIVEFLKISAKKRNLDQYLFRKNPLIE